MSVCDCGFVMRFLVKFNAGTNAKPEWINHTITFNQDIAMYAEAYLRSIGFDVWLVVRRTHRRGVREHTKIFFHQQEVCADAEIENRSPRPTWRNPNSPDYIGYGPVR